MSVTTKHDSVTSNTQFLLNFYEDKMTKAQLQIAFINVQFRTKPSVLQQQLAGAFM